MPRNENDEMVEEDWVEDCDQDTYDFENEDEAERKLVYNNMCSDEEDEQSNSHINARYKKRIVKNIFVNLPRMSTEDGPQEESKEETSVKLNLQSGGWSVKRLRWMIWRLGCLRFQTRNSKRRRRSFRHPEMVGGKR